MQSDGLEEITAIESQYGGPNSKPTLGTAYDLLLRRWTSGTRDRETALRLMFLLWYSQAEPGMLTGLHIANPDLDQFREFFYSAWDGDVDDLEICFVVSVMTNVAPWFFSSDESWLDLGETLRNHLGDREFSIGPEMFEGRGAYGHYFAHQTFLHPDDKAEIERQREAEALKRDKRRDH